MQYWENYFLNYVDYMHYLLNFLYSIKRKPSFAPNFSVKSDLSLSLIWEEGAHWCIFTNLGTLLSLLPFQGFLSFFSMSFDPGKDGAR